MSLKNTKRNRAKALGYPKDRLGNTYGPEHFDSDHLPSSEQVRRSHDPGWYDARLEAARKSRIERDARRALLDALPTDPRNMH